jgi:hypothetical protein
MPIGSSGRIVVEVDPELKRRLYSALALDQRNLKDWFVAVAEGYIATRHQNELFPVREEGSRRP